MDKALQELGAFIDAWVDTAEQNKAAFLRLKNHIESKADVQLDFIARPGVTYSLRVAHKQQKKRSLYAMVDVIEDEPRWLSICFYDEMVDDPEVQGDFVPVGLLGEDAVCFDVESFDEDRLRYIESRLDEAHAAAAQDA
jgi:hypothetical protein